MNQNGLLGDALSCLPAIWEKVQHEKVYLVSRHSEVAHLLPTHTNLKIIDTMKDLYEIPQEPVRYLHCVKNFDAHYSNGIHMAQGNYSFLDLPIPPEVPTVPLQVKRPNYANDFNQTYDFIISANSRSDSQNNKLWPFERWQEIINWLLASGYTVAALTSGRKDEHYFNNLDGEANGLSLKEVGGIYIKQVKKAVISIDNGISHFTRMLGAPHILLYPQCLPRSWVNNPNSNCLILQKDPLQLTVDEVKSLIGIFLATCGSEA
jgi:ADP-heptose:LPS heptosyltransferase